MCNGKKNRGLTLTIIANMTANYGESLGNISSVQKVYRYGKSYGIRSKESMKNAIMVQSGLYDNLKVNEEKGVRQKKVDISTNISNNPALEGGYMNTSGRTKIRKSSFYLTDAISFSPFIDEARFHNNLYLAEAWVKEENEKNKEKGIKEKITLQDKSKDAGLMPYQYEYDKSLKCYSITIDLDRIGVDENFDAEAEKDEKKNRVKAILNAVKNLELVVKGSMDNAEPIFIVGGIGERKTHYFENAVQMKGKTLLLGEELRTKIENKNSNYRIGLLKGNYFDNESDIEERLEPVSIEEFFNRLLKDVEGYYDESSTN